MGDTGFIRSADLQTAYGIDRNVATKMLNRLVDAGVLLKEGERRGTRYRPGPAWEGWIESPGAAIGKGHSIP